MYFSSNIFVMLVPFIYISLIPYIYIYIPHGFSSLVGTGEHYHSSGNTLPLMLEFCAPGNSVLQEMCGKDAYFGPIVCGFWRHGVGVGIMSPSWFGQWSVPRVLSGKQSSVPLKHLNVAHDFPSHPSVILLLCL